MVTSFYFYSDTHFTYFLGNGMGYSGVFQGNPCPYPSKPVPIHIGMGFDIHGSWVRYNPQVSKPVWDQYEKQL